MSDDQSTGNSEIAALAHRVATARGKLPLQHDAALVDVLSEDEIRAERELAEWIRTQRRGQRRRAVQDELAAEKRGRRTTAAIDRADEADARWHRRALAARRRVANQDARLAQLYRRAEWSSRALIGVVVLGMIWAGVNVQHNLVPSGDMSDPLYWLSYGIEAMISIPIITIMVVATTAARWGRELPRGKVVFFETALLGTTVALNTGPHLAAGHWGKAAEFAIAPVMVGVVIWLHAWVAARYAQLIDSVPLADEGSVVQVQRVETYDPARYVDDPALEPNDHGPDREIDRTTEDLTSHIPMTPLVRHTSREGHDAARNGHSVAGARNGHAGGDDLDGQTGAPSNGHAVAETRNGHAASDARYPRTDGTAPRGTNGTRNGQWVNGAGPHPRNGFPHNDSEGNHPSARWPENRSLVPELVSVARPAGTARANGRTVRTPHGRTLHAADDSTSHPAGSLDHSPVIPNDGSLIPSHPENDQGAAANPSDLDTASAVDAPAVGNHDNPFTRATEAAELDNLTHEARRTGNAVTGEQRPTGATESHPTHATAATVRLSVEATGAVEPGAVGAAADGEPSSPPATATTESPAGRETTTAAPHPTRERVAGERPVARTNTRGPGSVTSLAYERAARSFARGGHPAGTALATAHLPHPEAVPAPRLFPVSELPHPAFEGGATPDQEHSASAGAATTDELRASLGYSALDIENFSPTAVPDAVSNRIGSTVPQPTAESHTARMDVASSEVSRTEQPRAAGTLGPRTERSSEVTDAFESAPTGAVPAAEASSESAAREVAADLPLIPLEDLPASPVERRRPPKATRTATPARGGETAPARTRAKRTTTPATETVVAAPRTAEPQPTTAKTARPEANSPRPPRRTESVAAPAAKTADINPDDQLTLTADPGPEPRHPRITLDAIAAAREAVEEIERAEDLDVDIDGDGDVEIWSVARAITERGYSRLPVAQVAEVLTLADQSWTPPGIGNEVGVPTAAVARILDSVAKVRPRHLG
ncbi:hypothetical protein ACTD5D_36945 [Nocardia takedensis]|uniref:hypothetical protein n=1 Tax=Nocardia takedensis TaxID=259390 RepID=UPI0003141653|nr:hypothetical protein [Nocardia takedensis]